jgi:membrane protein implicated in regulation of membrane protease activity
MEPYLIWIIAGFALVIIELITGTFYLLVFGLAAFVGALATWLGAPFLVQIVAAGIAAGVGAWIVHRWHARQHKEGGQANAIDIGQSVTMESWVNKAGGVMRVRYRGTDWDARVADNDSAAAGATPGTMLYILAQEGHTWVVGTQKPAANAGIG